MSHHLIEARDLHFSYPDGTEAIRGLSFRIEHGEAVGIIGENGAGKSTLLQHLSGCLMPSGGTLRIGDLPLLRETVGQIRRSVGTIFQDPDDQLFMPTVGEDVAFGPLNMGLPAEEVEARVVGALEAVGALRLRARPPYKLSGGEKRAVAIATVLAMSPDILVLDEPTAGLDPRARRRLLVLLQGFVHTRILATHDLDLVMELFPRALLMHQGKILADGPTEKILEDEALLEEAGLERPRRGPVPKIGNTVPTGD
ncbi:MAG: energy-coupling factor ABC transporter ATP-binding protein [Planctomycetes bacterium]|nr:energy-coupling factor ABC transporter ATP-binding protein [Planctomycetota bacterium]